MNMRDGTVIEQVYPTRYQAEIFLHLLPMLMATQPHDQQVASAILSPLVHDSLAVPVSATSHKRFDHLLQ